MIPTTSEAGEISILPYLSNYCRRVVGSASWQISQTNEAWQVRQHCDKSARIACPLVSNLDRNVPDLFAAMGTA